MKLYGVPMSPFVQRVLLTARFKGQEIALETLPGVSLQSPEFAAISPLSRIPVLTDDDLVLCESAAIAAYLDATLPGPKLVPADPASAARHRMLESLLELEVATPLRQFMIQRVFHAADIPAILEAARPQLARGLAAVETVRNADDIWAVGDTPGPADAMLAPILAMEDIFAKYGGLPAMLSDQPGIAAYHARARAHPIAGRTFAEIHTGFAAAMARKG